MQDNANPYESPAEPSGDGPVVDEQADAKPVVPYASPGPRAAWAVLLLVAIMVVKLVSIALAWVRVDLLDRMLTGEFVGPEVARADLHEGWITLLLAAALLGSAVSFLMWFHRVHRNLPALGNRDLRFTPGWAVGWWFIPFVSLVYPFLVMKEVVLGSDPSAVREETPDRFSRPSGGMALVRWWWAFFLIMCVVRYAARRMAFREAALKGMILAAQVSIVEGIIALIAAVLAILVVLHVTRNQQERSRLLAERT